MNVIEKLKSNESKQVKLKEDIKEQNNKINELTTQIQEKKHIVLKHEKEIKQLSDKNMEFERQINECNRDIK